MKITKEWLESKSACSEGMEWLLKNYQHGYEYGINNKISELQKDITE